MIVYQDLGIIEYKKAWEYQEGLFNKLLQEKMNGTAGKKNGAQQYLLFCEHPNVFTLGKSGKENNMLVNEDFLKKIKATYVTTNRGGDITFHGPGQIVGYPVLDLEKLKMSIKSYIFFLEETIIHTLKEFSVKAERLDGATGVWMETQIPGKSRKICAMGVKSSRFVTMHGFALNVNTDLSYFNYIHPCGFQDKGVTSMQKELGEKQNLQEVKSRLMKNFQEVFKVKIRQTTI